MNAARKKADKGWKDFQAVMAEAKAAPHPICDRPDLYDRGLCCGRTPCVLDAAIAKATQPTA